MSGSIFDKLKEFVIKQSFVEDEEITANTRIEEDLGIYGDDAVEFIVAYSKEFSVDVSRFMAADYFSVEGGINLFAFIKTTLGSNNPSKKVITVGHLEKGIIAGRLDEDVINS